MNIQGLHNLCVVYVERGKLRQALECLQRAHKLAPEESYILKHLNIVKQRIIDLSEAAAQHKQKNMPLNENVGDTAFDENDGYASDSKTNENNATTTDNTKSNVKEFESGTTTSNNNADEQPSTRKNQKHPDDSTISEATNSINPNGMRRHDDPPNKIKIDAVNAETESNGQTECMRQSAPNRRTGTNKVNHERTASTSATRFGHDSDEPSSGTS